MSEDSKFDATAPELMSTERHLHLAEDAARLIQEQVKSQRPQFRTLIVARVAAKAARAAVRSSGQSLTPSESALQEGVTQLAGRVGELGDKVA